MIDDWFLLAWNSFATQRVQLLKPTLTGHKINSGNGSDSSKNRPQLLQVRQFPRSTSARFLSLTIRLNLVLTKHDECALSTRTAIHYFDIKPSVVQWRCVITEAFVVKFNFSYWTESAYTVTAILYSYKGR